MADFVVISYDNLPVIKEAITRFYGESFYEFTRSVWFISDNGSTKEVSDKLGITAGDARPQGIVLRFDAYAGFGPTAAWTWMAQHTRAITNG